MPQITTITELKDELTALLAVAGNQTRAELATSIKDRVDRTEPAVVLDDEARALYQQLTQRLMSGQVLPAPQDPA